MIQTALPCNKGFLRGSLCFSMLMLLFAQWLPAQQTDLISVVGTGDIMLGTNYPTANYLPPNNGAQLLADVADVLRNADVTFGNLEGTMFDGSGTPKRCKDMSRCYVFRTPASYVEHLVNAGFDVVSLANNHSGDFGPAGRNGTKKVLQKAGIHFAGLAQTDEWVIFERNGSRFGFAAFAPNSGTCDIRQLDKARQIVAHLDTLCDIVIVSFHGGAEGADHQHVPKKTEYFLGENRGDVYGFAHAVIDVGADIVFGHGPHVTRAIELYKDRFIAYSLGNFCTWGRFSLNGPNGVAPIVKIYTDKNGAFVNGQIFPVFQTKTHGPRHDPEKRALKIIQQLTKADFPDTPLIIDDEGQIWKREVDR